MSTLKRLFWATLLLSLGTVGQAALPQAVDGEPLPSLAPLVQRVSPAVVNIRVSQTVDTPSVYGDEITNCNKNSDFQRIIEKQYYIWTESAKN